MNVDGCEIDPKFIIHDDVLVLVRSHNICYLFRLFSYQLEVFTQKCKSCDFRQKHLIPMCCLYWKGSQFPAGNMDTRYYCDCDD